MNAEIDISNVCLHTERLLLRPFQPEDLDDLYEYAKVEGVGPMAGWNPHKNKEESRQILNMFIEEKKTFAIVYENKVVGSIGIEKYSPKYFPDLAEQKGRELGYVLAKSCWGKGLMPEACREIIRWIFEDIKLDFLVCGHFDFNGQSARVQEKLGFKFVTTIVHETISGAKYPGVLNILMKEDYFQMKGSQL